MSLFAATLEPLAPWPLAALSVLGLVGVFILRRGTGIGIWSAVRTGLRLVCSLVLGYSALCGVLIGVRQVAPELSISLSPVWPWPVVVLMSITTIAVILGTYPQRLAAFALWQQKLLLGLRLTAAILLILACLRPVIQWSKKNDHTALLPILVDVSRSMNTKDAPGGISRFEAERKLLNENRGLLEQLSKKVQLPTYDYSKELIPIPTEAAGATPNPDPKLEATGEQTSLGYVLDMLLKESPNQSRVGIIMVGDFGQRALAPYDLDPRLVAQRLSELRIPVYTVPFGATSLSSSGRDLIAEDLVISPTVFVKNKVIVGAKIRALGAAGRDQTVQLLVEQPGQISAMEVRKTLKIRPAGDADVIPVELDFTPYQPGEFRVTLKVLPDENEPIVSNNELTTFVTVLKGGLNIAYFDVARPEVTPIANMAKSPDIQLDFKAVRFGKRFNDFSLEEEWFQPGKYDVYIIGSVPAEAFKQTKFKTPPLQSIHDAVERGAGLLMIGGPQSFGPGGYADTPLAATLPVMLNPNEKQIGSTFDPEVMLPGPISIVPTQAGLKHFVMRIDSPAQNLAKWQSLPPLQIANKFGERKNLAEILARAGDGNSSGRPLLVAQDFGRGRSMAFAGYSTFLWALAGHEDVSQRFWRQVILWLAHKELQGDSSVWLKMPDRRFRPSQPIDLVFGAKNPDGVPIADANFKVQILGPNGFAKPLGVQQAGQDHAARFTETLAPGEYTAAVDATHQGKPLGSMRSRFIIYEHDLELHNPAADTAFADELSRTTGGKLIPPEELANFLRELLKKDLQPDDKKLTTVSLWDNWLFLLIFVTLMSLEWFIRKVRGLV
ncbi:MAG: hypothetical protein JWM11_607 [Planctomycetaceae bacterium]|nr:hypothetical protein [Planctomycetaceae bacterium]